MTIDGECECDQCMGYGPEYPEEHDEDCCCFGCHDEFHDNFKNFSEVCIYCDELEMEANRGNGERKEDQKDSGAISEREGSATDTERAS